MHWRSAALDRNYQDAHRRCSRSAPPLSHYTLCRLRPAHLQNAHATLTLGCRCHPCETLALGCCCRLCETLTLGCYCRPYETLTLGCYCSHCETLVLGCYCNRNFHVSLINFCWSDLWCVNEPRLLIPLDGKNARGSNTQNHKSTAENKEHMI